MVHRDAGRLQGRQVAFPTLGAAVSQGWPADEGDAAMAQGQEVLRGQPGPLGRVRAHREGLAGVRHPAVHQNQGLLQAREEGGVELPGPAAHHQQSVHPALAQGLDGLELQLRGTLGRGQEQGVAGGGGGLLHPGHDLAHVGIGQGGDHHAQGVGPLQDQAAGHLGGDVAQLLC